MKAKTITKKSKATIPSIKNSKW